MEEEVGSNFIHEAESMEDMTQGFESFYVYTDVMKSRVVGDSLLSLLRIVPIQGDHGQTVSKYFDHVQNIPLLCKEFGTIEIDIRDDIGHPVPFERRCFTFDGVRPVFFKG